MSDKTPSQYFSGSSFKDSLLPYNAVSGGGGGGVNMDFAAPLPGQTSATSLTGMMPDQGAFDFQNTKSPGMFGGMFDFLGDMFGGGGEGAPKLEGGETGPSAWGEAAGVGKALAGIATAYNGMKQQKQAEDQFDFTKAAYNQQIGNQAKLTNAELADRQDRRTDASGEGTYASTEDYVAKNGVSGEAIG